MNLRVEHLVTDDATEYKFILEGIPKPQIVDTSEWPKFTVEWVGRRFKGVYLGPGSYIINGVPFGRDHE